MAGRATQPPQVVPRGHDGSCHTANAGRATRPAGRERSMQHGVRSIFDEAQSNFRRTWPQLAVTAILYKVVAFAVLTPLVGLLLRLLVSTSGSSVVADEEILFFLLRPVGLAGMVVFGGLSLAIVALEQACLMVVAFGAAHGRRVKPRAALYYVKSQWEFISCLSRLDTHQ